MSTVQATNIKHASSTSTNLTMNSDGSVTGAGGAVMYAGGRNRIINGGFDCWQRGTSFSNPSGNTYTADRWVFVFDGSGATRTISQQTFTPGNAIAGYEPTTFMRIQQSVAGSGGTYNVILQRVEDVRTFAGQTVTFSFWAKAAANVTMASAPSFNQNFGSGGSATTYPGFGGSAPALTTSWQRFSYTTTVPSISGKTIGTSSYVEIGLMLPLNTTFTIDIWGMQAEVGSTPTPFEVKPFAQELRDCQRYFFANSSFPYVATQFANNRIDFQIPLPVQMRVSPDVAKTTSLTTDNYAVAGAVTSGNFNLQVNGATPRVVQFYATGLIGTAGQGGHGTIFNTYFFSAEL